MQTTKQKCLEFLTQLGMSDSQSESVLEQAKPGLEGDGYRVTWDRPAEEYPDPFYAVVFLILRGEGLKWIDANAPLAWFRPMFVPDPEAELARLKLPKL